MTEEMYYCGLCKKHMPISTFPHPHTGEVWKELTELLEEPEFQEDTVTLVHCPYCRAYHQKFMVDLCPMNPYKVT
jgi:hypothetical protein